MSVLRPALTRSDRAILFGAQHTRERTEPTYYGAFVDYSTGPQHFEKYSPFMVSSIAHTVSRFLRFTQMYQFYQVFSLHDIIQALLTVSIEMCLPGHGEYMMTLTEKRLGDAFCEVDLDELQLFYEELLRSLENEITNENPDFQDNLNYVFFKWIDPVSICFCDNSIAQSIIGPSDFTDSERRVVEQIYLRNSRDPSY